MDLNMATVNGSENHLLTIKVQESTLMKVSIISIKSTERVSLSGNLETLIKVAILKMKGMDTAK